MDKQAPQIIPQNDRKSTANHTANYKSEGDMKIINNYYADDSPVEVVVNWWDLIGLAFLVCCILALGAFSVWCFYEIGVKVFALWGWVAENWKPIAVGLFVVLSFASVTVWYYLTYTNDTKDRDLL